MRRQRMDFVIHLLAQCYLPDCITMVFKIENGFIKRTLDKAETKRRDAAYALSHEEAEEMVIAKSDQLVNSFSQSISLETHHPPFVKFQIEVHSLTSTGTSYNVHIEEGRITRCTCPDFTTSSIVCKHIFLASRVENLDISFSSASNLIVRSSSPMQPDQPTLDRLRSDRIAHLTEIYEEVQTLLNSVGRAKTAAESQSAESLRQQDYKSDNHDLSKVFAQLQSARRQFASLSQPLYAKQ
jgi:hypothetical protein